MPRGPQSGKTKGRLKRAASFGDQRDAISALSAGS
jgi:hypothetical protein